MYIYLFMNELNSRIKVQLQNTSTSRSTFQIILQAERQMFHMIEPIIWLMESYGKNYIQSLCSVNGRLEQVVVFPLPTSFFPLLKSKIQSPQFSLDLVKLNHIFLVSYPLLESVTQSIQSLLDLVELSHMFLNLVSNIFISITKSLQSR